MLDGFSSSFQGFFDKKKMLEIPRSLVPIVDGENPGEGAGCEEFPMKMDDFGDFISLNGP